MDDYGKTREELIDELVTLRAAHGHERGYGAEDRHVPGAVAGEDLQFLMDLLGDFLFIVDTHGGIIKCNEAASIKLGYSESEFLSMNIFSLYPPDRCAEAEDIYSQIISGEKILCDIPFVTRSGAVIYIETRISPGKCYGRDVIFSISRDVSAGRVLEHDLRAAFDKIKTVINSVPAYIWSGIIDSSAGFTYVYQSPAVEAVTGRPPWHFRAGLEPWLSIIHEHDRERIKGNYRMLMTGELPMDVQVYKILHAGGGIRWVRDSVMARTFGENLVRLDGVITDITELRSATDALQESENRLRGILSSMSDMVFAFDRDTRFTFYHTADMDDLYVPPDKFCGRKHAEVMPPEMDGKFTRAFEAAKGGAESEFEYYLDLSGKRKWFSAKLTPIMKDESFDGAVAVVRDFTAHKELEDAILQSEQRHRELFNNMDNGSFLVDTGGRMIDFTRTFADLLGYGSGELSAMTMWDITPVEWHEREREIIKEHVLKRGYSDRYRKEFRCKDGATVMVELMQSCIRGRDGAPRGMWGVIQKIIDE